VSRPVPADCAPSPEAFSAATPPRTLISAEKRPTDPGDGEHRRRHDEGRRDPRPHHACRPERHVRRSPPAPDGGPTRHDGADRGAAGGTMEDTTCRSTVGTIVAGWGPLWRWRGADNVPVGTAGVMRSRISAPRVTATAVVAMP